MLLPLLSVSQIFVWCSKFDLQHFLENKVTRSGVWILSRNRQLKSNNSKQFFHVVWLITRFYLLMALFVLSFGHACCCFFGGKYEKPHKANYLTSWGALSHLSNQNDLLIAQKQHYGRFWQVLSKNSTINYDSGGHNIVLIQEI